MRLDKLLANMQIGTRSEVKKYIRQGNVTVDGSTKVKPEQNVNPLEQTICCFGKELIYQKFEYYMLYKPGNCVTARTDKNHKTVMDYIDIPRRDLSPVGRLDLDTEGLLLITNDGNLSHNLLSPTKHVAKIYEAKVDGWVTEEDVDAFQRGLDIGDDTLTRPAKLEIVENGETAVVRVAITEGRYHQVKRMFQAVGKNVLFLKRLTMGSLKLDESLTPGEYRRLTDEEIHALKNQEDTDVISDKSSNL